MAVPNSDTFASFLSMNWENSGNGQREALEVRPIPPFVPADESGVDGYSSAVDSLNSFGADFTQALQSAAEVAEGSSLNIGRFRRHITELIEVFNLAMTNFQGGDIEFMECLSGALNEAIALEDEVLGGAEYYAQAMEELTRSQEQMREELDARIGELQEAVAEEGGGQVDQDDGADNRDDQPAGPGAFAPFPEDNANHGTGSDIGGDLNTSDTGRDLNTSDIGGDLNTSDTGRDLNTSDIGGDLNTSDTDDSSRIPWYEDPNGYGANTPQPWAGNQAAYGPSPMLWSDMLNRLNGGGEVNNSRGAVDRDSGSYSATGPAQPAPPRVATAAVPPTTAGNQTTIGAQPGATPSPGPSTAVSAPSPVGRPPGDQARGTEGRLYRFPGNHEQWVSETVYKALTQAFAAQSATDAHGAYEGTPAQWRVTQRESGDRVDGHPDDRIGPSQLITGDVALWQRRTALVVVWGDEAANPLEVVVNATLQPFSPEMADQEGDFGSWMGFMHPPGIEPPPPVPRSDDATTQISDQPTASVTIDAPA
ncbi:hypothetical protein [Nocardia sp. NPDC003963]